MKVCKIFEWNAAHQLKLPYMSKCNNIHGHDYKIEIELEGGLNEQGMIMDFSELKERVNKISFDHKFLNEDLKYFKIYQKNPTAEHLVNWIYWQLVKMWKKNEPKISRIRVWESSTSYAEQNY